MKFIPPHISMGFFWVIKSPHLSNNKTKSYSQCTRGWSMQTTDFPCIQAIGSLVWKLLFKLHLLRNENEEGKRTGRGALRKCTRVCIHLCLVPSVMSYGAMKHKLISKREGDDLAAGSMWSIWEFSQKKKLKWRNSEDQGVFFYYFNKTH